MKSLDELIRSRDELTREDIETVDFFFTVLQSICPLIVATNRNAEKYLMEPTFNVSVGYKHPGAWVPVLTFDGQTESRAKIVALAALLPEKRRIVEDTARLIKGEPALEIVPGEPVSIDDLEAETCVRESLLERSPVFNRYAFHAGRIQF